MEKSYRLDVFINSMDRLQNESLKNMMQEAIKESISDLLQVVEVKYRLLYSVYCLKSRNLYK